ncbi:MAG: hypothetical protein JXR94_08630, partial [Candidatus Hydrogenedentes bacterium]|nr:hypothetical protein [Candidatus Hydrogenedentota bacterium]
VIGRENMGVLQWTGLHAVDTPNCRLDVDGIERNGRQGYRQTLYTPEGTLFEERICEPTFMTAAASSHFIKEPDDYRVLLAYFRDMAIHRDTEEFEACVRALGEDGLPHTTVPRTPFQQLWIQWVNIQDLALHMAEYPDLMEEVIAVMTDVQRRTFEVVCDTVRELPVPYIDVGDNITAPIIGERYFRAYCVPAYNELAAMLDATGKDVPVFVHMDGDLKPLWAAIGESRVRGLDSMSPPPDNDTSVADALAQWPDMRLCINFPSSVHLKKPGEIYAHAMRILDEGGRSGRLQIQISENVPPDVWQTSFPAIVQAIADFTGAG